jgi:hypothetical protein
MTGTVTPIFGRSLPPSGSLQHCNSDRVYYRPADPGCTGEPANYIWGRPVPKSPRGGERDRTGGPVPNQAPSSVMGSRFVWPVLLL